VSKRFAMVGAGVSGLTCAARLQHAGITVTVFDKSRGPGGRITTRRRDCGRFDHGAQYFTAQFDSFQVQIEQWVSDGVVSPWNGRFAEWSDGRFSIIQPDRTRWVAQPRMSALGRHLAEGLSVQLQTRIVSLSRHNQQWWLESEDGASFGGYDGVLLCCPGPQAEALLPTDSGLRQLSAALTYAPCWVAMLHYEEALTLPHDGIRFRHPVLGWAARDSSKPGRESGERWVLQAQPEWSAAHIETSVDAVLEEMLFAWHSIAQGEVADASAHRWRFSLSTGDVGSMAEYEPHSGLGLCGDGLTNGRLEDAWRSGHALAQLILS